MKQKCHMSFYICFSKYSRRVGRLKKMSMAGAHLVDIVKSLHSQNKTLLFVVLYLLVSGISLFLNIYLRVIQILNSNIFFSSVSENLRNTFNE